MRVVLKPRLILTTTDKANGYLTGIAPSLEPEQNLVKRIELSETKSCRIWRLPPPWHDGDDLYGTWLRHE